MRVGSHDEDGREYDRIVLEFAGEGTPGWLPPQWVTQASTTGKGDPINIKGDHLLVVKGTGMADIPDADQQAHSYKGPRELNLDDNPQGDEIEGVHLDMPFEDEFQLILGTDSKTYRIFTLSDPTRLVIDVADDDQEHSDDQDRDDLGGSGQDQEEHGDEG